MCKPARSGIDDDLRKPFYWKVEVFFNFYAYSIGPCGAHGHKFKPTGLDELLHFDQVVARDQVHGGSNGALYCQWIDWADFDEHIAESICHCPWFQIKCVIKLCSNESALKRGAVEYNPAYKVDMLYNVIVYNLNAVTDVAELNLCCNETAWGQGGWDKAGSGLVGWIRWTSGHSSKTSQNICYNTNLQPGIA
jgi:hypothetical protein